MQLDLYYVLRYTKHTFNEKKSLYFLQMSGRNPVANSVYTQAKFCLSDGIIYKTFLFSQAKIRQS